MNFGIEILPWSNSQNRIYADCVREHLKKWAIGDSLHKNLYTSNATTRLAIATDNGIVVGYILLLNVDYPMRNGFIVWAIFTAPDYRQKGISSNLIRAVLNYIREKNGSKVSFTFHEKPTEERRGLIKRIKALLSEYSEIEYSIIGAGEPF